MPDRWLSVEEIAVHLGVSKDTIYGWIAKKEMPAHKVGRLWKFKADEVDEWVRAGKAADDHRAPEVAEATSRKEERKEGGEQGE
ncbi:helix-turn-helix domain-containing protein [Azospirillum brasilense]|uniref:helix-turn-helix domain-containing protein n=1 Tax=Azospirillum brasilense TaxID=192 RepID=UPI000E67FC55|nr:helix-turn-helix domain-containing protein [Azospirillum brasilense]NUB23345.1 helix-turn-helix domain-containing protein [Azospirillum brasilense]NUB30967.1 helix-turn-helix domain-containing protein [Azospirillum brasilense]RIW05651.1 helix-turn-helix domain-containing protein [Azospirillum brasilense]